MAIYRRVFGSEFDAEQIKMIALAYERILMDLGLKDRDDPLTELIADKIVAHARRGERDAFRLRRAAGSGNSAARTWRQVSAELLAASESGDATRTTIGLEPALMIKGALERG